MTYARARQCLIAILVAGNMALAWLLSGYSAEVKRLERVTAINVQTIAKMKADPQIRMNDAFRHYGENKVRKFLKKKGQAEI